MWRRLAPVGGAVLFGLSVWVLIREVNQLGFTQLTGSLASIPASVLLAALAVTALNYCVLTWHDQLAFLYARVRQSRLQIGLASFIGYAVSNNLGFAMLSGTSARYHFYSRWGISAADLSRIVLFYSTTFWLGLCLLGGASLVLAPALDRVLPNAIAAATGGLLIGVVLVYLVICVRRRGPFRIRGITIELPHPRLACAQIGVSTLDWLLAAGVLFVLLPTPRPDFLTVAGAFTGAQLVGLVSHVPGGLGVFEGLMVLFLSPAVPAAALLPALVLYRIVYYLLPLAAALALLLVDETFQRRGELTRWGRSCRSIAIWATPHLLAFFTFASGAVLLFSGATPAEPGRLMWLARVMPLPLLEVSHFTSSVTGLVLLLLSQAIARRVDAAFYATAAALGAGILASLLKGADYEEAAVLALVLAALAAGRRHFTRRALILDGPVSPRWLAGVGAVVAASVWLGFFAHREVAYSNALWWQFAFTADAPRFLRASVAVTIAAMAVGVRQLLRPAVPAPPTPDMATFADVDRVIARQSHTTPSLVYLGDKSLLWNAGRTAFLMYGVQGRSWVVLGDPVGPREDGRGLIRHFLEQTHELDLTPVFYEASPTFLGDYADFGFALAKVGEEARVLLPAFSLSGGGNKALRATMHRLEREGVSFRVACPPEVARLLSELRDVSDEWLAAKGVSEKGFSLGFFSPEYIQRFPVALIERDGRIEAFANLWQGPGRVELSPDLMRHRTNAPRGVMDAMFVHLMQWGQDQGYCWLNLGMAPLSGLPNSPVGRAWPRLGQFVYCHGEAFYNFQGLRAYKEKFDPVWEPRYLAYPGALALPRVLADVTALIAGGYRHIFLRTGRRAAA